MIERHDLTSMTDDQLLDRTLELSEHAAQTYLTPERRAQIEKQLAPYLFEAAMRAGQNPAEIPRLQINDAL